MRFPYCVVVYDKRNNEVISMYFSSKQYEKFVSSFITCKRFHGTPKEYVGIYVLNEDEVFDLKKGIRFFDSEIDFF